MLCNGRRPAKAAILVICILGAAGCQQLEGWFPKSSRKTPAYQSPLSIKTDWSGDVKEEQVADVQFSLARSLENQGQVDQAIRAYKEVVAKDPRRGDAYHRLAVLHDKKGDTENSGKYYETALKKAPKSAELLCDYGYSCYLQRRWEEAEKHLRRAVALQPDLRRAHNNLGLLLARTGRSEESLREFTAAGCSEADAHANLAFALALGENREEAEKHFRIALEKDPGSQTAKKGLLSLKSVKRSTESRQAVVVGEDATSAVPVSYFGTDAYPPSLRQ